MRTLLLTAAAVSVIAGPASAHEFVAYFDYGRAELPPGGYRLAREVAAYALASGKPVSRIFIAGYMDTSEAVEFSDELSRRRAQALASELVQLGLSGDVIVMDGRGGTNLARPTPPNSAEPLNRRIVVGVYFAR